MHTPILIAYIISRPTNISRGGHNTCLNNMQEAALKLYYKRCILASLNPEHKHIKEAANSILYVVGEPLVSKPWLTR